MPGDPYTNKSLIYERDGESVFVYSVGPNLKDDGGKPFDLKSKENDIVWRDPGKFKRPSWNND